MKEKKEAGYTIKEKDVLVARPIFHTDDEINTHDYKMIIGKRLFKSINAFEPISYSHF